MTKHCLVYEKQHRLRFQKQTEIQFKLKKGYRKEQNHSHSIKYLTSPKRNICLFERDSLKLFQMINRI